VTQGGGEEHLDGELVGFEAPLGRPRLYHLRQQLEQRASEIVASLGPVEQACSKHAQREAALRVALLLEKHPFDVRVLDNRHTALLTLPCVE
jgi:hypothetical protein